MTSVDYKTQVYCSHCGDVHERTDCILIKNWGYQCPECGGKCRVKAKYTFHRYYKAHHVPSIRSKHTIKTEIKQLAQRKELV